MVKETWEYHGAYDELCVMIMIPYTMQLANTWKSDFGLLLLHKPDGHLCTELQLLPITIHESCAQIFA
jgi:hypothetical protein